MYGGAVLLSTNFWTIFPGHWHIRLDVGFPRTGAKVAAKRGRSQVELVTFLCEEVAIEQRRTKGLVEIASKRDGPGRVKELIWLLS